jgi:DnaK suppressor protein
MKKPAKKKMSAKRKAELRKLLDTRGSDMQNRVHGRIRDVRGDRTKEVQDEVENSDAGAQQAIDFTLIQMSADTLRRIEEAVVRLDAGEFGYCFECEGEISEQRLRALPFAVRCTACEEQRESGQAKARQVDRRHGSPLYSDVTGY